MEGKKRKGERRKESSKGIERHGEWNQRKEKRKKE